MRESPLNDRFASIARSLGGQRSELETVPADRAFSVPKRVSQDTQTKLATVAAELVRTRRIPQVASEP